MKTTLLIMAAGIGSRFGTGIKQLEPVDDAGHIIMDYSIHDAIEAGFNHVVCRIHNVISFRGWHSEWNSDLQVHDSFLFSFLFSVLKIGFVHFIHDAVHILRGQISAGK